MIDATFIIPNNSAGIYQSLSNNFSAIETPTWALLLAQSCRSKGFKVSIIDTLAENLSDQDTLNRIKETKPKNLVFVVYGQNVNASTANMSGATRLSNFIKNNYDIRISYIGSHVQALPIQTIKNEKSIDIVFTNEGVYALQNLLKEDIDFREYNKINGIAYRDLHKEIKINKPEKIVPQDKMDIDLPGYAWDLLPFKNKPFDLYRAPMWHAEYDSKNRTPYAAIQTSLGCQFGCNFCMINIINRDDNEEIGVAGNYSGMRFWTPDFIIKEFEKLIEYGVYTIKITDEMFLLNPKYYKPLCEKLAEKNKEDRFKIWAYSRIDTVKRPEILQIVRKAGIKWLCLGIESGDKKVRLEVSKGKFEDVDVKTVVEKIHEADIDVLGNYIFGLPGDNLETMNKTLNLSKELCTSGWNAYAAMALPGSQLYKDAIDKKIRLPENYEGYSFHSYNTIPLPTEELPAYKILDFRDRAYIDYHSSIPFQERIKKRFGMKAVNSINDMLKIKLKRKIIEENSI